MDTSEFNASRGEALASNGLLGCAAGWGRIFTTRLTIMGSPFQKFSTELLDWGL